MELGRRGGWKFLARRASLLAVASLGYQLSLSSATIQDLAPGSRAIVAAGFVSAIVLPIAIVRHTRDVRLAPFRAAAGSYSTK